MFQCFTNHGRTRLILGIVKDAVQSCGEEGVQTCGGGRRGPVLRRDGEGQICQGEGKSSPAERRERSRPVEVEGGQAFGEGRMSESEGEGEGAEDGVLETDGGLGDLGGAVAAGGGGGGGG